MARDLLTQLDVQFHLDANTVLIESFAGTGATEADARRNAFRAFMKSSLHVLLHAFFNMAGEEVTVETWIVNGLPRLVTIGDVVMFGTLQAKESQAIGCWWARLESAIKSTSLPAGTHWIRFYHAQLHERSYEPEVLLDNQPWLELIELMAGVQWPSSNGFYSERLFLILQDAR